MSQTSTEIQDISIESILPFDNCCRVSTLLRAKSLRFIYLPTHETKFFCLHIVQIYQCVLWLCGEYQNSHKLKVELQLIFICLSNSPCIFLYPWEVRGKSNCSSVTVLCVVCSSSRRRVLTVPLGSESSHDQWWCQTSKIVYLLAWRLWDCIPRPRLELHTRQKTFPFF